jgi:hypothetical protein
VPSLLTSILNIRPEINPIRLPPNHPLSSPVFSLSTSIREKLKIVLRQYEVREQQYEAVLKSKELEILLAKARSEESKHQVDEARAQTRDCQTQSERYGKAMDEMQKAQNKVRFPLVPKSSFPNPLPPPSFFSCRPFSFSSSLATPRSDSLPPILPAVVCLATGETRHPRLLPICNGSDDEPVCVHSGTSKGERGGGASATGESNGDWQ